MIEGPKRGYGRGKKAVKFLSEYFSLNKMRRFRGRPLILPEPCLKGEENFWRRWQRERLQRVIYEDIRDLENVREISLLELLAEELPNRIGAPLSIKE